MKKNTLLIFQALVACHLLGTLAYAAPSTAPSHVAILGDSGASGVIADPRWKFSAGMSAVLLPRFALKGTFLDYSSTFETFADVYSGFGISLPLAAPRQLAPKQKTIGKTLEIEGALQLDLPEMSWGYFTGRAFGTAPDDIYFLARDGKRVVNLSEQIDTMSLQFRDTLPELTLISFTANDFCSPNVLSSKTNANAALEKYAANLRKSFDKLLQKNTYKNGSTVVLMAPLPVTKILRSESILKKEIFILGQKLSCRELRTNAKVMFKKRNMVESIQNMCPAILKTDPDDLERIAKLEEIFEQAVEIQHLIVSEAQVKSKGTRFYHFEDSFYLDVEAKDIANDCFHPSIYAHEKLAKKLIDFLMFQSQ